MGLATMLPGLRRVKSSEAVRRSLPLLALVAALLGTWLAPPAAVSFARNSDAAAIDTMDGVDRAAIKRKPLAQLQSSAKKRVATHGGSAPEPIAAASIAIEPANRDSPVAGPRLESISIRAPRAIIAQPRAPPFSRTLTPAV
jgi:hypothetical protein